MHTGLHLTTAIRCYLYYKLVNRHSLCSYAWYCFKLINLLGSSDYSQVTLFASIGLVCYLIIRAFRNQNFLKTEITFNISNNFIYIQFSIIKAFLTYYYVIYISISHFLSLFNVLLLGLSENVSISLFMWLCYCTLLFP